MLILHFCILFYLFIVFFKKCIIVWCKYTLGRTKGLSDLLLCGDLNDSSIFVGYSTPQAQLAAPWELCASLWGFVACCLPSLALQHSRERFKCDIVLLFLGQWAHLCISGTYTSENGIFFPPSLSLSLSLVFHPCSLSISSFLVI